MSRSDAVDSSSVAERVRLSVVVPCLDVAEVLPIQLEALSRQRCEELWELILVDNGCSDESAAVARSFADEFSHFRWVLEPRRGRQHACNLGVQESRGEYIVFVDADDQVQGGYLQAMLEALQAHSFVAGRLEHTILAPGSGSPGFGLVLTDSLLDGFGFLPQASGANLGLRRSTWDAIGGFSDDALYCEDADLSWRAQLMGFEIFFAEDAVVAYRQRSRLRDIYRQHRNFGAARAYLYKRYRQQGMVRRSTLQAVGEWLSLGKSALRVRTRDERTRWTRRLARNLGYVRGSLRYRVYHP